ncbi:MAG: hypothetical protein ACE5IW_09485 [bacterium]
MTKDAGLVARVEAPSFRIYGWIGILILAVAEFLLVKNNLFIKTWFTPIMWSGYILFADALIYKLRGTSMITDRLWQFLFMLPYSVVCWLIFEAYNLHLQNWKYIGLPENLAAQTTGYIWSFATIFPGVLFTSELIDISGIFDRVRLTQISFSRRTLHLFILVGLLFLIVPVFMPDKIAVFLFGPVWLGFIFILDPINYLMGGNSLFKELQNGRINKLLSLFLAGLICGLLWEFWNYWATAKWVYIFPYLTKPKIFEMPLSGYFGFLPFAVEIYVMWEFAASLLKFNLSSRIESTQKDSSAKP